MYFADKKLQQSVIRVVVVQSLATLLLAAGTLNFYGQWPAIAAVFGGALAIVVAVFTAHWIYRAGEIAQAEPQRGVSAFLSVAGKRMLLTIAGFAVGIAWLRLAPVPLLAGFASAYLGYLFASRAGRY
jgi:ATP synthase protein I